VPDHPDREQLAAFQAGELDEPDRGRTAAHVAGCPDCGAVAGAVAAARRRLALLDEPELPAGFHDRLAAAVRSEAAGRATRRHPAWYRRPGAWGTAAALLLFAAGVFGLAHLNLGGASSGTAGGASVAGAPNQSPKAAGGEARAAPGAVPLPAVAVPGDFTAAKLRAVVRSNQLALQALSRAKASPATGFSAAAGGQEATNQRGQMTGRGGAAPLALRPADQACVDKVGPAGELRPALLVHSSYGGRPARVLVAYVGDPSGQSRLRYWVFPDVSCSRAPVAQGELAP
jgi:anti-sigma factor RsiW